jgi:hypothetical protein
MADVAAVETPKEEIVDLDKVNEPGVEIEPKTEEVVKTVAELEAEKAAVIFPDLTAAEELQQQVRDQAKTISTLETTLAKLNDILVKAKLVPEVSPEEEESIAAIEKVRNDQLATILEMMELNPTYQDVRQIVTRKRFDDIVEQLARVQVTKEGGRLVDRVTEIENQIWGMPNPYKYMYGKIKEFHPDYMKPLKKDEIAPSIHDIPGGGTVVDGAWTAARIDAMSEDELNTVPADVYKKYLQNELK